MEVVKYIKDMLNVQEGSVMDAGIDIVIDQAPYVGKALQTYKIHKLSIRMNSYSRQFDEIREKIEASEYEILYKEQIFPIIMKQLMDDDEDEKAKAIIDGFEHIVDENIYEVEKIYHFYDVLDQLRIADMYLLAKEYYPKDNNLRNVRLRPMRLEPRMPRDLRFMEEQSEKESLKTYQQNKLQRLGLLDEHVNIEVKTKSRINTSENVDKSYTLSSFGKRFIDFFKIEEITYEE